MSDVTIILVTHNRPTMFAQAHASALATGARVVVVDDGSERQYAESDIRFERATGYALARCAALPLVETPYFAFLDDDDLLFETWLPLHLAAMADADIVAGSYLEGRTVGQAGPVVLEPASLNLLRSGHCPLNDGALIRTAFAQSVEWHPERDTVMMLSLWLALAAKGARFAVVERPTWFHRLHGQNMSRHLGPADAEFRAQTLAEHAA